MVKNIDTEIQRLLIAKEEINTFNMLKKQCSKIVPISKAKYDELATEQCLDNETLYYIFDKEIGQYIDGYVDIDWKCMSKPKNVTQSAELFGIYELGI